MGTVLITGSSGLVGSECVRHFARLGHVVHGMDNNQRAAFFGDDGDTNANLDRLCKEVEGFTNYPLDIRERSKIDSLMGAIAPDILIHCAAQPSHDLAAQMPVEDFEINAVGTLNLLEAVRQHAPKCTFIFASTNKVYGDAPNRVPLKERETRYAFTDVNADGIDETMTVDQSRHSLFGASKAAADLLVQEYGRTFGLNTACFRCGCLTGSAHAAAEQHGFLAYLAKCVVTGRPYTVFGYKGKQVRDNLHAADVAAAFEQFANNPKPAAVYNLGGGKANSCSVLEAIYLMESASGKKLKWSYSEQARGGDHICYYSDTARFRKDYPGWYVMRYLPSIVRELVDAELQRKPEPPTPEPLVVEVDESKDTDKQAKRGKKRITKGERPTTDDTDD